MKRAFINCLLVGTVLLIASDLAPAAPWKWIAYGDTRSQDARHREVLQAMTSWTPDYRFIINVGDVVSNGTVQSEWSIWKAAVDDVLGGAGQDSIPPRYISAPGNHDKCDQGAGLSNWHS